MGALYPSIPQNNLQAPTFTGLMQQQQASGLALEQQQAQDEVSTNKNQGMVERLNTENSIRSAIQSALHAISEQAQSLSQQFIGDEIGQVKKGVENSGKAV